MKNILRVRTLIDIACVYVTQTCGEVSVSDIFWTFDSSSSFRIFTEFMVPVLFLGFICTVDSSRLSSGTLSHTNTERRLSAFVSTVENYAM